MGHYTGHQHYRGFDVLTLEPDRGSGTPEETSRKVFVLDSVTGIRTAEAADPSAAAVRGFAWLTFDRHEASELRDFLDERRGRAVPFWIPAWEEDFTLTADHGAGSSVLTVIEGGYATHVFPAGNVRRHLAILLTGGAFYFRKVLSAVDNGNGTETITLEEAIPPALPVSALIAVLRFVRLEDDAVEIEWAGQFAEAQLRTRDLPTETPA